MVRKAEQKNYKEIRFFKVMGSLFPFNSHCRLWIKGVKIFYFFLSRIEIPPWTSNNSLAWIVDFTYEKDLWNCVQSCLKPSGVFLPSLWGALQWMLVKPIISWKWLVDCKEKKAFSHLPKWNSFIAWLAQFRPVGSVCCRGVSVKACSKYVPSLFTFPLL